MSYKLGENETSKKRFSSKSNTTITNYFVTFSQNVDVANFLLVFI